MVKKALDPRITTLIKNNVQNRQRSMFVIVGDKGKDQVVNLHWLLSQTKVAARPSVLWCYKKDLGFTSNRKKRESKIKRDIKKGVREANEEDPFELFVSVTNIRYTYYKESEKILGNTYGMCVLQDFEALTPNLLARTIETVEGGGIVVLLLRTMKSLKQLYTMTMDVHSRYRTEAHDDITSRFNERFILSLGASESCLVVDDEFNVLPISAAKNIKPLPATFKQEASENETELQELKDSMADTQPIGALVATARTLDQGKALLTFVEAISEKTLRSTVTLTAGRGRGKSAALGMAIAAAVAYGYSNIFVTSPHPDNLKTLFEFILKGFDALDYSDHLDYDIIKSTNKDFNNAIVRINVFRQHRQTIQYIQPQDHATLAQAELLVIDEAAAIPLPTVKKLLGPYLVFMASTINGYEGTGRSLSLKLFQQLREESRGFVGKASDGKSNVSAGGRSLREVKLEEPIRYSPGDPVELWLNKLLCLDASIVSKNISGCPHPDSCELYYVHRDTLFSYHPVSETFLQRMMALYVASHYKNTPNDLQLMSDAPAHHLFVLLPPVSPDSTTLPDPLVVVQVCLEGQISRQSVLKSLSRGQRASGDLIPWLVSQQFQDDDFASLSGARIVRIATHPDYTKMGYGARAIRLLTEFYEGKFQSLDEQAPPSLASIPRVQDTELESADLTKDKIRVRDPRQMPPLLLKLSEVPPHPIHYLGVSYGLTRQLHTFWKRSGFAPLYVRQTCNELTGEHSCVMLKPLAARQDISTQCSADWMNQFSKDFHRRFISLLSYQFRDFDSTLALSILEAAYPKEEPASEISREELSKEITTYDMKRLESYSNNLLDYHVIMDLVPRVANYHFGHRLPNVKFSSVQDSILLSMGLQHKSFEDISSELGLPVSQLLALFAKAIKKSSLHFKEIVTNDIARHEVKPVLEPKSLKRNVANDEEWDPLAEDIEQELDDAGKAALAEVRDRQKEFLGAIDLSKYAIKGDDADFEAAASTSKLLLGGNTLVSVPSSSSKKAALKESAAGLAAKLAQQNTPNPNGISKPKKKKAKKN
ncbi:N-acetyltransferase 10 [Entomophthora muscae]|uniref:N-acetyltransferase 10 n=1 Tax=Entomophthora muscae TaxID=34485 RepID=A0ACC2U0W4_9FUNG|nr:N-acetyltransferase 10 [Entomophthora muscae]